jgi:hypothetical protein
LEGPFYEATYANALSEQYTYDGGQPKEKIPFSRSYSNPEPFWQTPKKDKTGKNAVPLYSRHFWTAQDNVFAPAVWRRALELKETSGWADDHPSWLREWLGQWVSADDVFVYTYAQMARDPKRSSLVQWKPDQKPGLENRSGLPNGHDWRYVLGLDLGFEDDFAMVVGAYSLTDGSLYHCYDYKVNHQDVDQVAAHVLRVCEMFGGKVDAIVADSVGLGKMVVETLNRRHGLAIIPAEKREKNDFI